MNPTVPLINSPEQNSSHRLSPLLGKPDGMLVVHEVYRSLQGEGTHAGLPCVFIRLTACHLRCFYCDTPHAFKQGRLISFDDLIQEALNLGELTDLIELTGGEPLLHPEAFPLMTRLADRGRTVLLETSGACSIANVDPRVHVILDLKTPGSGESRQNDWTNLEYLKPTDDLKFVITDREDFEWMAEILETWNLLGHGTIIVSAASGWLTPVELADWVLASRLPLRLQTQLHKDLWGPETRGV